MTATAPENSQPTEPQGQAPVAPASPLQPAVAPRGGDGLTTIVKVLLSVAILAGVVGFFRYTARGHTSHYKMVDEVMISYGQWVGKPMKVHGYVEPGSIDERVVDQEMVATYNHEHNGKRITLRNKGTKSDSFKDRSEVVAEGKIVEEGGQPVLISDNLMAKCPSKYQGAPKDKLFEE